MKILYWPHVSYKSQFFLRYVYPAKQLAKHGHEVRIIDPRKLGKFADENKMADNFLWADIIVAFFPKTRSGLKLIEACRQFNKKLVVDCDDFTYAIDPSNPAYAFGGLKDVEVNGNKIWVSGVNYSRDLALQNQLIWGAVLETADGVTLTTSELASLYSPMTKDKRVWVLPNSLDLSEYRPFRRRTPKDRIRIGWAGGGSHFKDLRLIAPVLTKIRDKYPNVDLVFLGSMWPSIAKMLGDFEYHPWVDSDTYQLKLGSLDFDIGICPIEDNLFDQGKSNLKMLEYGAFKVPSICSAFPGSPYLPVSEIEKDDRILVPNEEDEWFRAIESLITSESDRKRIGEAAFNTASTLYNIENTWKLWEDCYQTVLENVLV